MVVDHGQGGQAKALVKDVPVQGESRPPIVGDKGVLLAFLAMPFIFGIGALLEYIVVPIINLARYPMNKKKDREPGFGDWMYRLIKCGNCGMDCRVLMVEESNPIGRIRPGDYYLDHPDPRLPEVWEELSVFECYHCHHYGYIIESSREVVRGERG